MDELAFRHTPYQIVVSLMKWQLAVRFLLAAMIDTLFSWLQQPENCFAQVCYLKRK